MAAAEIAALKRQLEEKDRLLEVATLQNELAQKQALLDQLGSPTGAGYQAQFTPAPTEADQQVMDLMAWLRSPDAEERVEALFSLSDIVTYAFGDDGLRLGELMRSQGGLSQLMWLLADVGETTEVHQQTLLDKSLTISVSSDGVPMWLFEHSWGDGVAMLRTGMESWLRIRAGEEGKAGRAPAAPPPPEPAPPPRRLEWRLTPSVSAARQRAADDHAAVCASLDVSYLGFGRFGAAQLKELGVSPDGAMQAALQLAFYNTAGRIGATYESCSTGHYLGGRTETIRPATTAAAAWVHAAAEGAPPARQAALLRASVERHATLAAEAASGRGFDRHLYVLQQLAAEEGRRCPLFSDAAFGRLCSNELSTSTLAAWSTLQAIFGPVHPEGYGVMYIMTPSDQLRCCVTAYKPRSAARFTAALEAALAHVGRLLGVGRPAVSAAPRAAL